MVSCPWSKKKLHIVWTRDRWSRERKGFIWIVTVIAIVTATAVELGDAHSISVSISVLLPVWTMDRSVIEMHAAAAAAAAHANRKEWPSIMHACAAQNVNLSGRLPAVWVYAVLMKRMSRILKEKKTIHSQKQLRTMGRTSKIYRWTEFFVYEDVLSETRQHIFMSIYLQYLP